MDLQAIADSCALPCAVMSTEKTPDGRCGEVRIVCGNQAYRDAMGPAFHDNMIYTELVPQEDTFEDFCFRSCILGQRVHAYVRTEAHDTWTDMTLLPLVHEDENLGYALFMIEMANQPDAERMASVSLDTAAAAVKASIALLGAEELKDGIRQVLDEILVQSDGFSARVVLVDEERKESICYCDALSEDAPDDACMSDYPIPYETVASWKEMIGYSNEIIITDYSDYDRYEKYNPEWVALMRAYKVDSLIMMALRQGRDIIGFMYVTNFDVEQLVATKELLELMSYLMSVQISNNMLMKKLEFISNVDGLTGLFNRRAMLRRMHEITESEGGLTFGVINIDLNGLKIVNDRDGHDAGDKLLVQASEVLRKIFRKDDLFRTGGDEFIVIAPDIDEDVFERKVERLRNDAEKNDLVSFAVGSFWSDGSTDVRTAFTHADELMYADKSAFYDAHPEVRRR